MPTRTCEIRPAKGKEAKRIHSFYQAKNDVNVLPRPLEDLQKSAEKGLFFVAETNANLIAVSGVFDLGPIPYVELGGTLVDEPVRGFRIQELLFRLRIASVVLNQGTEMGILTAVDPSNEASTHNAVKCGFNEWPNPVSELFEPCESCPKRAETQAKGRRCCCEFYILPAANARREVQNLLDATALSGTIRRTHKKTGENLAIEIRSQLLTENRALLAAFATGEKW